MLINQSVAISTSKVLLVPYCGHHVSRYHQWMQDPEIQRATASEPLTLEEEHAMQQSWREDSDKLTFIVSRPLGSPDQMTSVDACIYDSPDAMVGDVNMFLSRSEDSTGDRPLVVGELELMIAERAQRRKGSGRAALLSFIMYVLQHEAAILRQFWNDPEPKSPNPRFAYFAAKIGKENTRSLALFGSLGFKETTEEPNYWSEYELRNAALDRGTIESLMAENGISQYTELYYRH